MTRRRGRRERGLLTIALESDWRLSLTLGIGCLFLPAALTLLAGGDRMLRPLLAGLSPVLYLLAMVFGGIAALKCLGARREIPAPLHTILPPSVLRPPAAPPLARPQLRERPVVDAGPRPQAWSLAVLREMEWKRFEEICLAFYRAKGIAAASTPLGPDGGVDLRLYQDAADPARCTAIVQCKAWGERHVGVKPVRELRGVMLHEGVDRAFFMAPGAYSEEAKDFAAANRIILIDGPMFLAMLRRLPEALRRTLLLEATLGDWTTPSCPRCGTKMLARNGRNGQFWGCRNYPGCRQKMPLRDAAGSHRMH